MHLYDPILLHVERQELITHKFQKFRFPKFGKFRFRNFRSLETEQDKNLFPVRSNSLRRMSLMQLLRVLVIMCRQQRRPVKGGRIMKPPSALQRHVRVDVDLRNGVGSAGAQSHFKRA